MSAAVTRHHLCPDCFYIGMAVIFGAGKLIELFHSLAQLLKVSVK